VVCLLAAPGVQLFAGAGNGWPHSALRYHQLMPISCHVRDCKALLITSLTHESYKQRYIKYRTVTFNAFLVFILHKHVAKTHA